MNEFEHKYLSPETKARREAELIEIDELKKEFKELASLAFLQEEKDEHVSNELVRVLDLMRASKPNDRSEKDRRYAVSITELEKAFAYFQCWVID